MPEERILFMGPYLTRKESRKLFESEVQTTDWWKHASRLKGLGPVCGDFEEYFWGRLHDGTYLKRTFLEDFLMELHNELQIHIDQRSFEPEQWSNRDLLTKKRFFKKWSGQSWGYDKFCHVKGLKVKG